MDSTPISRISNPSPYQLPQHVSNDRRRARQLTIALTKARFPLVHDEGLNEEQKLPVQTGAWPGASNMRRAMTKLVGILPPKEIFVSELPPEARFTGPKFFRHGTHAGSMKLRQAWVKVTNFAARTHNAASYERLLGTIPPPSVKDCWESDAEFARQRLAGVNPIAIRRCSETPGDALAKAADQVLVVRHGTKFSKAMKAGRVYMTEYPMLWDKPVQEHVRRNATLAAPTCLFYTDDCGVLMPLAIQLKPRDITDRNPVFTPLSRRWDWMMARGHAQASDSHYHESISHLLETHLVCEIFALATLRNLHTDHPLHQLMFPHFEHTLAINEQARKNLLAPHGEIAKSMAAKHTGNINLVRMMWSSWKYQEHSLKADLEHRDVRDLPGYLYRDDATEVYKAIEEYARGILEIWYVTDDDVINDVELQSWTREVSDPRQGGIKGFPEQITTREQLFDIASNVIFRASAQHAAVNNGQFGAYGWVPNAPVAMYSKLPDEAPTDERPLFTERDFYRALPDRARALGQTGMVWLLSEPTERSILRAGELQAFTKEHCFEAYQVVGQFRRRLRAISDAIDIRNDEIGFEYNYLKPQNIDHSISI
ncbi:MAG: lipoxygenase family protein [Planctomycetota bacterium]|nr:lipoxygenase family protein [Planctomycetota bacterium]